MTREEVIGNLNMIRVAFIDTVTVEQGKLIDDTFRAAIEALEQEPKTGHWIKISPAGIYECSECGQNVMTSDICAYKFCHGCSVKMIEPQESEE